MGHGKHLARASDVVGLGQELVKGRERRRYALKHHILRRAFSPMIKLRVKLEAVTAGVGEELRNRHRVRRRRHGDR